MPKSTIRRLVVGHSYGFIRSEQGNDLFFHNSKLKGVNFSSLREGQKVQFEIEKGRNGRPQAVNVRLAQPIEEQNKKQPPL